MADVLLDLFGDPIPEGHEGPGRPSHVADDRKRCKVMMLLAMGHKIGDVAMALGVDQKTLRKHYSRELAARRAARLRLEGELLVSLATEAAKGNVGAVKELLKLQGRADIAAMSDKVANRGAKDKRPEPVGKKEAAQIAAKGLKGRFERREPPPGTMVQ